MGLLALLALAVSLGIAAAGWTLGVWRYGGDDAAGRARLEADVRRTFDRLSAGLHEMASAVAAADVRAAAGGDLDATARLFDGTARLVAGTGADVADAAITVYATDGRILAWAGRPSELPADRLTGAEAWFMFPHALGLRLVRVAPVSGPGGARVGTVATERAIAPPDSAAIAAALQGTARNGFRVPIGFAEIAIELPFEGGRTIARESAFAVSSPTGAPLLTATVVPGAPGIARRHWNRVTFTVAAVVLLAGLLLLAGPLLDWRNRTRAIGPYATAAVATALLLVGVRLALVPALAGVRSGHPAFSSSTYASPRLGALLSSPIDLLLTLLTAAALVALLSLALDAWRIGRRHVGRRGSRVGAAALHLLAGGLVALLGVGYAAFLRETVAQSTLNLLRFSIPPWNIAAIVMQAALLTGHACVLALGVAALRTAAFLRPLPVARSARRLWTAACWVLPLPIVSAALASAPAGHAPLWLAHLSAVVVALRARRIAAGLRHGSQAFRLAVLALGLLLPAIAFYPAMFRLTQQGKTDLVERQYAAQALTQRQSVLAQLQDSLTQIDRLPDLDALVRVPGAGPDTPLDSTRAFRVWQTTPLATYPVTSAVEIHGLDGALVSRFAFNFPEDPGAPPGSDEHDCAWDLYEEVVPFFAEERRVWHAGRAICTDDPSRRELGSIVVHATVDYENLPFISSHSPYVELLRPASAARNERGPGLDVEYAVYGWSRTPIYSSSDTAWSLDDTVFARLERSREPIWADLRRGPDAYRVFLQNNRGGIYALGFPAVSPLAHLVNLAELTLLTALLAVGLIGGHAVFSRLSRRAPTGRALLREVRASFYRKLFLAFVAAAFVPVVLLAVVTRSFVATELRKGVEEEALRTARAAARTVEDLVALRQEPQGISVDDDLMVSVSRLVDEDTNVFGGAGLAATSERNLFASGLLPVRTPADVHRALRIRREAATVTRERIGAFDYLVAAAPLTLRQFDGLITVPLTSRERDIEAEIEALDRRVLLVALLFILGGAGLGYSMAERIADPVSRLTRATRRIASGDLDARIAATSSDELGRLVDDFNRMAGELQRQRVELERTNRLEAWAEMARQVAHDIKNPLTPIQLNAEHLRRVHADRGEPMGQVLKDCVETILSQVTLLRRIASEFSNFASAPTARRTAVDAGEILRQIVDPYRAGLSERIRFDVHLPDALPLVLADRSLVARALTNIVENALFAMPGPGTLSVRAWAAGARVHVSVTDTGGGMDAEALARAFEPYFSTKASGTGLGLPIAKRNIELNDGTIRVSSEPGRGTTVEIALPTAPPGEA